MINLLFIFALQNLREIDEKLGREFAYTALLEESKRRTRETFFCDNEGLYAMTIDGKGFTALGNALAILTGLVSKEESEYVCEKIARGELIDCSLSMKTFKYDALYAVNKEKWRGHVRDEIRKDYGEMVSVGDTVWETGDGAAAFDGAGSLCHGWSAIPILYLD